MLHLAVLWLHLARGAVPIALLRADTVRVRVSAKSVPPSPEAQAQSHSSPLASPDGMPSAQVALQPRPQRCNKDRSAATKTTALQQRPQRCNQDRSAATKTQRPQRFPPLSPTSARKAFVTDKIGVPCGIAGATWQCMLQLYINISWRAVRDRRCHLAVHVATHQAGQPNGRHNGYD